MRRARALLVALPRVIGERIKRMGRMGQYTLQLLLTNNHQRFLQIGASEHPRQLPHSSYSWHWSSLTTDVLVVLIAIPRSSGSAFRRCRTETARWKKRTERRVSKLARGQRSFRPCARQDDRRGRILTYPGLWQRRRPRNSSRTRSACPAQRRSPTRRDQK